MTVYIKNVTLYILKTNNAESNVIVVYYWCKFIDIILLSNSSSILQSYTKLILGSNITEVNHLHLSMPCYIKPTIDNKKKYELATHKTILNWKQQWPAIVETASGR
jgi:hypothetical protein